MGDGCGVPTPLGIEAIHLAAQTEGLILDPVYMGRAMSGLIDHTRQNKIERDQTVTFIHTGGTPAIFAFSKLLLAMLMESIGSRRKQ